MSVANTFFVAPSNLTNTAFQAWSSSLSDALDACGLVLANTDPVGTHNAPTANDTAVFSEVWAFADSLQNTAPVFIKLEYGSGANVSYPSLWITVGSGTSGNAVTGNTTTRLQLGTWAHDANTLTCYVSGDTNRFAFSLFTANGATPNTSILCGVERLVSTPLGRVTANGVTFVGYSANVGYQQVAWDAVNGPWTSYESSLGIVAPSSGTGRRDTIPPLAIAVYPVHHVNSGTFFPVGLNWLGYFDADLTPNRPYYVPFYHRVHTFMALGTDAIPNACAGPASGSTLLMRYD